MGIAGGVRSQLASKFEVLFPHLDERQRRLLMGAEARVLGRGGVRAVARAAGVSETTVRGGVDELESGAEPMRWIRRPGDGRKKAAEVDPGLGPALFALVEPDERGDPVSPLRWTIKSTRNLAAELTRQGHRSATIRSETCCARRGSACRPIPRRSKAPRTQTATASSATSTSRPGATSRPGSRSSAWARRRRSWSATTRTMDSSGPRRRAGTGQDARLPGPAGPGQGDPVRDLRRCREHWVGERRHRPRRSRSPRSASGGRPAAGSTTRTPTGC